MTDLVQVTGLEVMARNDFGEEHRILHDIGFTVARGEVLALIGESGSGKTTTALALLGYARPGCRFTGGSVRIGGTDLLALPESALAGLRGRTISYIAQSAAAAFNPSRRLMDQVTEGVLMRRLMSRGAAEEKAKALFASLALPDPERIGQRYPHQVSGGQLQRLMAAMALMTDPDLVVLDEPTTALDVTTQVEVLRAFRRAVRGRDAAAVYVSHDLAVVAQMADRTVVMRDGRIREIGTTTRILTAPQDSYTRELLTAAAPKPAGADPTRAIAPLLDVSALTAGYGPVGGNGMPALPVLHDIAFRIAPGSALGVIGESGSGKSTLARVLAGLLPAAKGSVTLDGTSLPPRISDRTRDQLRRIQIVFQMADTALNPAHSVQRILARPLAFYRDMRGAAARRRVDELLDMVKLPRALASRLPSELSGGQKQRVNLARALAADPALILCDEVTSSLDTVVGEAILELLAELRRELGVALMFISHDLKTVRAICDQVMILYAGRMMEIGAGTAVTSAPAHPYADLLAASIPQLRVGWLDGLDAARLAEAGGMPDPRARDACAFFSRCALRSEGLCEVTPPPWRSLVKGSTIRCHRTEAELIAAQCGQPAPETAIQRA